VIYVDTTSVSSWKHASGLARVSRRLRDELGSAATGAAWPEISALPVKSDWILTPELFSEPERPGFTAFLDQRPCRIAAVYHDAIPIKFPAITWPRSVERHPAYMKLLARFDRVWAVSPASRDELLGFWKWQGVGRPPPVDVLAMGADWVGIPRAQAGAPASEGPARIVSVGILEPRKNQAVLLDACEALWGEGMDFELHLVGRVNPHFGGPIAARVREMAVRRPGLRHHDTMDDAGLAVLIRSARATAFASLAEGFGLPLLESLWLGVPCVCSDIAPLAANAAAGGCSVVTGNSLPGWIGALRRILADDGYRGRLAAEASSRTLPTWKGTAETLRSALA
jgi:glycosyltransferase involved in cell wall biosynthesis